MQVTKVTKATAEPSHSNELHTQSTGLHEALPRVLTRPSARLEGWGIARTTCLTFRFWLFWVVAKIH